LQLNQLNIRDFDLRIGEFKLDYLSLFNRNFDFLRDIRGEGTFIITARDLNDYLRNQGKEYKVEINDYEIYVVTYAPGVGKMKIAGRLEGDNSGAAFVAERLIEPKLPSLIFFPQIWINSSFYFSLSTAYTIFKFDRFFVDKKYIKVFFRLKKGFYEELFKDIS
jgi:hypothetical protein